MANHVDLDQTGTIKGAVCYGSALFAYVILLVTLVFEILGHLPFFFFFFFFFFFHIILMRAITR